MLTLSPSGLFNKKNINIADFLDQDPTYISRYLLLAGILEQYKHHEGMKQLRVLELGGAGTILPIIIDINLDIVDTLPNNENLPNYIEGNALTLPYADNTFDAVVSSDVLEHIPEDDRALFLKEAARVSKDILVVAAPYNLPGVRDAEIAANDFYKKMTGKDHRWLLEHFLNKLPDIRATEHFLEAQGFETGHFSSTSLDNWQLVTRVGFLLSKEGDNSEMVDALRRINECYLNDIMQNDFSKNGYRTFVIASKNHEIDIKSEPDSCNENQARLLLPLTDAIRSCL